MKVKLEIDDFLLEFDSDDESHALTLLSVTIDIFRRKGFRDGCKALEEQMVRDYKGKPGWTFKERVR